ncbi:hypothetical protein GGR51DRAFT_497728 [Nemania sp. FL0031]|nr:hypothetical protein GGR51DRAFT_497728 [Nemania sp. FL0031]
MSGGGWRDVVKNGWHPEKSGSSLKSQVKGFMGRGDAPSDRAEYVPTPRSALRDPSSFGPPPKHVAAYGPAAAQGSSHATRPAAGQTQDAIQPYQSQQPQYAEEEPPPEPKPYRFDTTGLSTSHLPPPPGRSGGADGRGPQPRPAHSPSPAGAATIAQGAIAPKPKAPPSLPPRLPPRSGNSTPSPSPISAIGEVAGQGYLNQGAISRLGAAGISVPGLGIGGGGSSTPPPPPRARPSPPLNAPPTQAPGHSQVDELQARFARMGASSSPASDSRTAAEGTQQRPLGQVPSVIGKKKPPPPPAPKKPGLSGTRESAETPPPIPLATRPRFD